MSISRKQLMVATAGAAVVSRVSLASTDPSCPITLVVPYAAGGPADVLAEIRQWDRITQAIKYVPE